MPERLEAIIIGSGFGGAVTACRLAKKWPGKVLVIERGKRYELGSFPRSPHDVARNFWNLPEEGTPRPKPMQAEEAHGMFDVRTYRRMDVIVGAGLGGGSLIYANVILEPPEEVFDEQWPSSCKKPALLPYYRVVKEVLGARPIPVNADPRRRILRKELFQDVATTLGRTSGLADIAVFFGNDFAHPLPIGEQTRNRYGALQTSCVYCAECVVGCNTQSKNTLDLNYLFVAEKRNQATVLTEHVVEKIVPVNERAEDDPLADGAHGYRVHYRDLRPESRGAHADLAARVIVAAGTLGTNELLLRAKSVLRTLPRLSVRLGERFSGNGDFISFVLATKPPADPNYGPTVTQITDFNLFDRFDRNHAFIVEDAAYPNFAAWFIEGVTPGPLTNLGRALRDILGRLSGSRTGPVGDALMDLLSGDVSYNTAVILCIGVDKSNGLFSLDTRGNLTLDWPGDDSRPLYDAIVDMGKRFRDATEARKFLPLPTWLWPFRRNVTVHPLGGAALADTADGGVASALPASFGQVFGYRNLYVADGALVPTAVGANPAATISALAERVAEGITGLAPDPNL